MPEGLGFVGSVAVIGMPLLAAGIAGAAPPAAAAFAGVLGWAAGVLGSVLGFSGAAAGCVFGFAALVEGASVLERLPVSGVVGWESPPHAALQQASAQSPSQGLVRISVIGSSACQSPFLCRVTTIRG